MLYVAGVALLLCFLVIIWNCWLLRCNNLTAKHRTRLINVIHEFSKTKLPDVMPYYNLIGMYDKVSYERHMWEIALRRNPFDLYDSEVQKLYYKDVKKNG